MSSGYNMSGCYFENDCNIKNERLGFQVEKRHWWSGEILSLKGSITMLIAPREKSKGTHGQKVHLTWKILISTQRLFRVLGIISTSL